MPKTMSRSTLFRKTRIYKEIMRNAFRRTDKNHNAEGHECLGEIRRNQGRF